MIRPSTLDLKSEIETYFVKAQQLLHSKQTRMSVDTMLTGPDPVQRVANVAVMVMQRVDSEARKAELEVQDSVKVVAAHRIVQEIIETGEAGGIFDLNKDLELLALSVSIQDYLKSEVKAGRVNAKQAQVALQADLRSLPPKLRKEATEAQPRLQQIARKYAHGQGLSAFPPDKKTAKGA